MAFKGASEKLSNAFYGMHRRCGDTSGKWARHYQDKGIYVCRRWQDFSAFAEDMGEPPSEKHELDRIDNSKGYCPDNCQWATRDWQTRNSDRPRKHSPYRNVHKRGSKWCYAYRTGGKLTRVSGFETPEDAGVEYNKFAAEKGWPLILELC